MRPLCGLGPRPAAVSGGRCSRRVVRTRGALPGWPGSLPRLRPTLRERPPGGLGCPAYVRPLCGLGPQNAPGPRSRPQADWPETRERGAGCTALLVCYVVCIGFRLFPPGRKLSARCGAPLRFRSVWRLRRRPAFGAPAGGEFAPTRPWFVGRRLPVGAARRQCRPWGPSGRRRHALAAFLCPLWSRPSAGPGGHCSPRQCASVVSRPAAASPVSWLRPAAAPCRGERPPCGGGWCLVFALRANYSARYAGAGYSLFSV